NLRGSVKQTRDEPDTLALMHFENLLYGDDHPGGRAMTLESLENIARKDLVDFHNSYFLPKAAVLAISGDFQTASLIPKVTSQFRNWKKGELPIRKIKPVQLSSKGLHVLLVDKPDLTQSFFAIGHAGIRREDPQRDAAQIMNYVLGGGGFSSRMMKKIRAEGGKTYGITSRFSLATVDGSFEISTFTRTAQTIATLKLIQKELHRIQKEPPTENEIAAAKGKIAGGYALRFQTIDQLASALATAQIHGLKDAYVSEYPLRVNQLTATDLANAAKQKLHPDQLIAVIVGNADKVAPLLKTAGIKFELIHYLDPISARKRK
ncbi:MAG: pitrilysin family protein, partial [Pseudomonadota bacterium]